LEAGRESTTAFCVTIYEKEYQTTIPKDLAPDSPAQDPSAGESEGIGQTVTEASQNSSDRQLVLDLFGTIDFDPTYDHKKQRRR
jgi:hypothetical protein